MTPIIELIGVCKSFGGLRASWDISFSISEGEIVGLIGPNGAGKTTLINLISGNLNPDSGKIIFRGAEIQDLHRTEPINWVLPAPTRWSNRFEG